MKYSTIIASALVSVAWAVPQQASTTSAVALPPQASCIAKCPITDVNCQALCVGSAHPDETQVVKTTQCAEKCDQGDGSPAATQKFSDCVQSCIKDNFPTTSSIGSGPQGSNAPKASGSASGSAGPSQSGTASPTATDAEATNTASGSAAASSTGAATSNNIQMGVAGIAGLFMAVLAL